MKTAVKSLRTKHKGTKQQCKIQCWGLWGAQTLHPHQRVVEGHKGMPEYRIPERMRLCSPSTRRASALLLKSDAQCLCSQEEKHSPKSQTSTPTCDNTSVKKGLPDSKRKSQKVQDTTKLLDGILLLCDVELVFVVLSSEQNPRDTSNHNRDKKGCTSTNIAQQN